MFKSFLVYLLCIYFVTKETILIEANECALNTECKYIQDCPRILDNFDWIDYKPYCNLTKKGAHVCCLKAPEPYIMGKDEEDTRAVKECKSYQNLRTSCPKELIVSGNKTEPKEFPFMALLIYQTENIFKPLCGGTLISKRFVLTAAHCLFQFISPNIARLGELDWSTDSDVADPVDFEIKNKFIHHQYYKLGIYEKYNDIALAELARDVVFNDFIMPACLPLVDGRDFKVYMAAGWGYTNDYPKKMEKHMHKVKLDHFDDETCLNKIEPRANGLQSGINKRTQMCAGSHKDRRDTCDGDSGGPLFVDHPDYKCLFLILGITSFKQGGCGIVNQPAVYTRIQLYLEWIEQIVWNEPAKLS